MPWVYCMNMQADNIHIPIRQYSIFMAKHYDIPINVLTLQNEIIKGEHQNNMLWHLTILTIKNIRLWQIEEN